MAELPTILSYLLPWEFSLAWTGACLLAVVLYLRGARRLRATRAAPGAWRRAGFLLGVVGIYAVTQTHYDYLAQYMFFTHRAQHLVLHHAAPFLIALSAPWAVLAAGLPDGGRERLRPLLDNRGVRGVYRVLQHPLVAPVLFVGLIYFWLIPSVHFDAMLSRRLYDLMNWSMALDGLLFWWLILDPRPGGAGTGRPGFGARIAMVLVVMVPQILLGAMIFFSSGVMFDVYEVCGRAWPLSPITDQQLGGLFTWIPAAMMSVIGALVLLSYIMRRSAAADPAPAPNV